MAKLLTFQLVFEDGTESPVLTSTRGYGEWFEQLFPPEVSRNELYRAGWDRLGNSVWEWHPGSKIGQWFDKKEFASLELHSWYVYQDSLTMSRLQGYGIAEWRDAIPTSVSDKEGRCLLRCYSLEQLKLYIKTKFDPALNLDTYCDLPILIPVAGKERTRIITPRVEPRCKKLF